MLEPLVGVLAVAVRDFNESYKRENHCDEMFLWQKRLNMITTTIS